MISYRQFDQWMEQGKIAQLVDLREPWMFEQDRIWGSVNIPYDELENLMGEIRKDGTIVFYCDRGAKSMVVCRDLWRMGYIHFAENWILWKKATFFYFIV